ncbi:MAG TPA: lysozyme inhibitor LprI family protein [Gaiellaceae bacterium]|nr:lysozyme inhibitor LprI family protein [Gaiellaceae bacterium]
MVVAAGVNPPVIHESFTLLPCPRHPVSTLDLEGCDEHAIVETDAQINARVKDIFGLLRLCSAGTSFVAGEQAWLRYRSASCRAESSKFAGGTLESVHYGGCLVGRNKSHLAELAATKQILSRP